MIVCSNHHIFTQFCECSVFIEHMPFNQFNRACLFCVESTFGDSPGVLSPENYLFYSAFKIPHTDIANKLRNTSKSFKLKGDYLNCYTFIIFLAKKMVSCSH